MPDQPAYSTKHSHEPEIPPSFDKEGRCLICVPNSNRKTISWNLWDLERKDLIQKVAQGVYARLDFTPESTETLLD